MNDKFLSKFKSNREMLLQDGEYELKNVEKNLGQRF
jgi:hypothetical protein